MKHNLSNPETTGRRDSDPGLQPERTVLAWYRTAFVCLINGLLLLRYALRLESLCFGALSLLLLLLTAAMYLYACVHRIQTTHNLPGALGVWFKRFLTGIVVLYGAIAALYFAGQLFRY